MKIYLNWVWIWEAMPSPAVWPLRRSCNSVWTFWRASPSSLFSFDNVSVSTLSWSNAACRYNLQFTSAAVGMRFLDQGGGMSRVRFLTSFLILLPSFSWSYTDWPALLSCLTHLQSTDATGQILQLKKKGWSKHSWQSSPYYTVMLLHWEDSQSCILQICAIEDLNS